MLIVAHIFFSSELSINKWIRGGHIYASWILWWFLAEHAALPHLTGQMYTSWYQTSANTTGEIFLLRELVENANLDFGDVWSICIAHIRTWDFPKFGDLYKITEQNNFNQLLENPDIHPPIPYGTTLEERKNAVEIDPFQGTNGQWVAGPSELRPGPNGWNCLTIKEISLEKSITIQIEWDQGMGFNDLTQPESLRQQQIGCDEDPRFYNSVVIAHNEVTGIRRYWKLKGKKPSTLHITVGESSPLTIYIILVPTPPADYVLGIGRKKDGNDGRMSPIPAYGYKYNVKISEQITAIPNTPEAEIENGLMKLASATPGWWPVKCTCLENPNAPNNRCVRPTFDGVGISIDSKSPSNKPSLEPSDFFSSQSNIPSVDKFASQSFSPVYKFHSQSFSPVYRFHSQSFSPVYKFHSQSNASPSANKLPSQSNTPSVSQDFMPVGV